MMSALENTSRRFLIYEEKSLGTTEDGFLVTTNSLLEEIRDVPGSPLPLTVATTAYTNNAGLYEIRTSYNLGESLDIWFQTVVKYVTEGDYITVHFVERTPIFTTTPPEKAQLIQVLSEFVSKDTTEKMAGLEQERCDK